jgi:hypothetical protein
MRVALRLTAVAGAVLVLAAAALGRAQPPLRFEGEHGLAVHLQGDSVVVRWLTAGAQPGSLVVMAGERALARVATATGFVHRAAFPAPAAEHDLLLEYGGAGERANRFRTQVSLPQPARPSVTYEAADSVFVLGDTHGMYDELLTGLQRAELIDSAGRWTGGRRHLVLAGDLMDRGPDVAALLWTVYRLEREAEQAGGRVHVILGNHEIMVMMGDLRYVHPKESHIAELHGLPYDRLYDVRNSILGRWLASKTGALRIGNAVIVHGGLSADNARPGLRALDDSMRHFMAEELFYRWSDSTAVIDIDSLALERRTEFFIGNHSLFWHRGYVTTDTMAAELAEALRAVDGSLLVVGHTAVDSIHERYGGQLVAAHTRNHGGELLLLVREGAGFRRYRVTERGTEPFSAPAASH